MTLPGQEGQPRPQGEQELKTQPGQGGLRSARERLIQTLAFEAGGLLLVAPLYALATGSGAGESLGLIATLALVVMAWSALYNTAFDVAERRLTGRVASDRSPRWRLVHAVGHEATALVVTWPVIVAMTDLSWGAALAADMALTIVYAAYAYGFHRLYDRLRPVAAAGVS